MSRRYVMWWMHDSLSLQKISRINHECFLQRNELVFFFLFEETIIHLPGEWQLTFFLKIPGLFLPAVVRPMLDSFESSKQVPQPALSDVSIEFWFMINFLIHWQNYGCLSSLQCKFKQVPFLALVVFFSILMPFTLCFVM